MAMSGFAGQSADQIYQTGPEVLALESARIVTGPVSEYSTQVHTMSQGTSPIPLTWTVSGRVAQPHSLKGAPVAPGTSFSRRERSRIEPPDASVPEWHREYGNLGPDDWVVLFFNSDAQPKVTVLPSATGPRDLAGLLSEMIPIQEISGPEQAIDAWLRYLGTPHSDEGRKAALRSLLKLNVAWPKLAPTAEFLMSGAGAGPGMRGYVFGIVTYAVIKERFGPNQLDAADFLSRHFAGESDPRVALGYILNLKLLLRFTQEASARPERAPLESKVVAALRRRAASGNLPPELAEQYRQIQATYPGLL